ncbi:hypothetical protein KKI19_00320 [Patescibacteria group bacterium]|nr:hypothetical protein [Patescibacteria group bacterium]
MRKPKPQNLFLDIAEIRCRIISLDPAIINFLEKKFSNFLSPPSPRGKRGLIIRVEITPLIRKAEISQGKFSEFEIRLPSRFVFESFNFIFRDIFGNFLILKKGLMLHASSFISEKKQGFIFVGPKDAGKSTIVKLFPEFIVLADDSSIIRLLRNQWFVYGSPFYERHLASRLNIRFPLVGVFFLRQADKNRLVKLKKTEATEKLIRNVRSFRGSPDISLIRFLQSYWENCYNLVGKVPVFNLDFKKDRSFFKQIESYFSK